MPDGLKNAPFPGALSFSSNVESVLLFFSHILSFQFVGHLFVMFLQFKGRFFVNGSHYLFLESFLIMLEPVSGFGIILDSCFCPSVRLASLTSCPLPSLSYPSPLSVPHKKDQTKTAQEAGIRQGKENNANKMTKHDRHNDNGLACKQAAAAQPCRRQRVVGGFCFCRDATTARSK